ncbi:hypothetical protein LTR53_013860 [Teratosphaeriaceae sp. CCFEE 6253]|nr:hypothetical protein LTR53_013860 [Teratosphaeriaceae sp. CCFEE 6253]
MGWPYHFVDLSSEQKDDRRRLLDYYGALAQLSLLIPLLVQQCYFVAKWLATRWRSGGDIDAPSSPCAKHERSNGVLSSAKAISRRLHWWSSGACSILGVHVGTNGEALAEFSWTAWLLLLCVLQTDDDYFHLTKRFGIVASSQLPLHYLLALKSPFSPLQLLTHCSHETLNTSHQLLGRIVTLLVYLHAVLYLNLYIQVGVLRARLTEAYVLCGIAGIIAFTVVGTTALSSVRKWSYRVFYITHVTLATVLLPALFFHVHHIRIYLYETALIYGINVAARRLASHTQRGTLQLIPGTNLLAIEIPLDKKWIGRPRWQPGQHAYVSLKGHPLLRTFRSNPFTVASVPDIDKRLHFVARVLDGNTAKLAQAANASKAELDFTVEGPYGVASHSAALLRYDRVLFLAGGVGATFIVPLYRQLLADLSPSKGSYRREKVAFAWAVRSVAETTWALPADPKEKAGFLERLHVYVTGLHTDTESMNRPSTARILDDDDEAEEAIELQEHKGLLSDASDEGEGPEVHADSARSFAGRPNLSLLVDQVFAQGNSLDSVAIVVCGPRSLRQALRTEVSRWVSRGRDVWLWDESFAV